ncbi:MAG: hypothetical protein U5M50_11070 [Sphingobium sp.]|nr:hypothetical protein [Sphingobium sp.]
MALSRKGKVRQSPQWLRAYEEFLTPWNIVIILVGLLIFIGGMVLQQSIQASDDFTKIAARCILIKPMPEACAMEMLKEHESQHAMPSVNLLLAFAEALKNLGIAFILSVVISVTIERRNRSEFFGAISEKSREISLNVFQGIFNNAHPPALLAKVRHEILEKPLIRDYIDVIYTLSCLEGPKGTRIDGKTFIKVDVILSTVARNVSTDGHGSSGVDLPLKVALPNPMVDELKGFVRLAKASIDGKDVDASAILAANENLQEQLADDTNVDAAVEFGMRALGAGDHVAISANYTMVKELEDTEVLRSLHTTQALNLTVADNTGLGLIIMARGIHPGVLEVTGGGTTTTKWRLSDIILPQQGIMVWWKQDPNRMVTMVDGT